MKEILIQIRKAQFFKERKFLFLFLFSLFLNFFIWFYLLINHRLYLFKTPLTGLIILMINFILGFKFYLDQKKSLAELLFYSFLIIQFILLLSLFIS